MTIEEYAKSDECLEKSAEIVAFVLLNAGCKKEEPLGGVVKNVQTAFMHLGNSLAIAAFDAMKLKSENAELNAEIARLKGDRK